MSIEKNIEDAENEKLVFLGKAEIRDHCNDMVMPEPTTLVRAKKGYANFYNGKKPEGSRNGWYERPEGTTTLRYSDYRPTSGSYGKPMFR